MHSQRTSRLQMTVLAIVSFALAIPHVNAAPPPPMMVSVKAGDTRHWQAGTPISDYSIVTLRHGNVFTTLPLTSWAGKGPSIDFKLYHNSKSTVSRLYATSASGIYLGPGWTCSYMCQLWIPSTGICRVLQDDGTLNDYTLVGGVWTRPSGVFDDLVSESGGTWRLTQKDQSYRRFNSSGRLIEQGDAAGNLVIFSYQSISGADRLTSVTDASGRSLSLNYESSSGRLQSIVAPLTASTTRTWVFEYSTQDGSLIGLRDPLNHVTSITYDGTYGKIVQVADPNGNGHTITYDKGSGLFVNDPAPFDGQMMTFDYDDVGSEWTRTFVDRRGNTWKFVFDSTTEEVISYGDLEENEYEWSYDSNHNRVTVTNLLNRIWRYEYDAMGNTTSISDPLGNCRTYTFNTVFNKPHTRIDPDEITPSRRDWAWTYDATTGNVLSETDPASNSITYTYYSESDHPEWLGLLKTKTDRLGTVTLFKYDAYGQPESEILDPSDLNLTKQLEYDFAGRLVSETSPRGVRTDYVYDANSRLTQMVVDAGDNKLKLTTTHTYDAAGRKLTTTNPRGTVTKFEYDNLDRLTKKTEGYGLTSFNFETTFQYDANGNRTSMTDAEGKTTSWTYDEANKELTRTNADNKIRQFVRSDGRITDVINENSIKTTYTYDDLNRVTAWTVDSGSGGLNLTTQVGYSVNGGTGFGGTVGSALIKRVIDPAGRYSYFEYDLMDRRTAIIRKVGDTDDDGGDSDDAITRLVCDAEGRELSKTIVNNSPNPDVVTTTDYDRADRIIESVRDPNGANLVTTYAYDGDDNLLTETWPNGNITFRTYDNANRCTATQDSIGAVESRTYDANGNALTIVDGTGKTTTCIYDALDRKQKEIDPLLGETLFSYDKLGHVRFITDPKSHVRENQYDNVYRLSAEIDPLGQVVSYEYDGVDNLLSRTATNGSEASQTTSYTYDHANRRLTETYPDDEDSQPRVRSYEYHPSGTVWTRTDQNGDVTTYSYDDLDRLTSREYTISGASPTWPPVQGPDTYSYDLAGRLLTANRIYESPVPDSALAYTHDGANRVTGMTQDSSSVGYAYTVSASTNRRQITYPSGRIIREDADKRDRISAVANLSGGNPSPTLASNTYDLEDRLLDRAYGNSLHALWSYNSNGEVTGVQHTTVGSHPDMIAGLAYGRDAVGNPLYQQDLHTPAHSQKYWHDNADRLSQFKRGTLNQDKTNVDTYVSNSNLLQRQTWTLDAVGNWDVNEIQKAGVSITEPRTNNKANEYLTIDYDGTGGNSAVGITHDPNGNIRDDGTWLYDYDVENRLTRVRRKSDNQTVGEYYYNALGHRIRKVVTNSGSGADGAFEFVISPDWQVLELHGALGMSSIPRREFIHAGYSGAVDDHVAVFMSGSWRYIHADAMHNTVALTDSSGAVIERYVTDPHGNTVVFNKDWTSPRAASTAGNIFHHQGLQYDAECGKYHNRRRDYLPTLGRFAQRDPIGYVDGPSLYGYVRHNPVYWMDPSGLIADMRGVIWPMRYGYVYRAEYPWLLRLTDWAFPPGWQNEQAFVDTTVMVADGVSLLGDIASLGGMTLAKQGLKRAGKEVIEEVVERGMREGAERAGREGAEAAAKGVGKVSPGGCFAAGTLILASDGLVSIEKIQIGDRIITTNGAPIADDPALEPETWRVVKLTIPNPNCRWDLVNIELLRSMDWLREFDVVNGNQLRIEIAELGLSGLACVESIVQCPQIKPGEGRVVLATVNRWNADVYTLGLEGTSKDIHVTGSHALYSETANDWVPVSELASGDVLRTCNGTAEVTHLRPFPGVYQVFNLEVQAEHQYFVSTSGILAHNSSMQPPPTPGPGQAPHVTPSGKPKIIEVNHKSQKSARETALHGGDGGPPMHHPKPKKGTRHYHSTVKGEKKNRPNVHHNY